MRTRIKINAAQIPAIIAVLEALPKNKQTMFSIDTCLAIQVNGADSQCKKKYSHGKGDTESIK